MEKIDLSNISTEKVNPDTKDIDRVSTLELVKKINNEDKKVALAIEKELDHIASAIDIIVKQVQENGRLIYIGAGTSGRLGILDASECPPTYGVPRELVQGVIAGGERAVFESVENAEDNEDFAIADLININLTNRDVLVGIAASGRTPYVLGGLKYANSIGSHTVAISCSSNSPIGKEAKIKIEVECGPEVVSGSTRMKSGTAQKMILNMLSTGTMIKLGKVYGNLMVDVVPLNAKLIERCKKIFMEATSKAYEEAEYFLSKSHNNMKLAILMSETNSDLATATAWLDTAGGHLYSAIQQNKE